MKDPKRPGTSLRRAAQGWIAIAYFEGSGKRRFRSTMSRPQGRSHRWQCTTNGLKVSERGIIYMSSKSIPSTDHFLPGAIVAFRMIILKRMGTELASR